MKNEKIKLPKDITKTDYFKSFSDKDKKEFFKFREMYESTLPLAEMNAVTKILQIALEKRNKIIDKEIKIILKKKQPLLIEDYKKGLGTGYDLCLANIINTLEKNPIIIMMNKIRKEDNK